MHGYSCKKIKNCLVFALALLLVFGCFSFFPASAKDTVPEYWNSNDYNWVTPVKQQGLDDCWSYALSACIECSIISGGYETDFDCSEGYFNWIKSRKMNKDTPGGTCEMLYMIAEQCNGVAREEDFPTDDFETYTEEEFNNNPCTYVIDSCGWLQPCNVKKWIMENGSAFANIVLYEDEAAGEYIYFEKGEVSNHGVCVVGWDDNISGSNFGPNVADGAWICKNSWGTYSGNKGYFYLSYDSADNQTFFGIKVKPSTASKISFADGFGAYSSSISYLVTTKSDDNRYTMEVGNVFEVKRGQSLECLSGYVDKGNYSYVIYYNSYYSGQIDERWMQSASIVTEGAFERGLFDDQEFYTTVPVNDTFLEDGYLFACISQNNSAISYMCTQKPSDKSFACFIDNATGDIIQIDPITAGSPLISLIVSNSENEKYGTSEVSNEIFATTKKVHENETAAETAEQSENVSVKNSNNNSFVINLLDKNNIKKYIFAIAIIFAYYWICIREKEDKRK